MKPNKTRLLIFFNNKKNKKMAQQIDAGQTLPGRLVIWDTVTDQEVPTVFFSEPRSSESSDESIVTVEQSTDHAHINFTGVATGTATVHITATANYENSNGATVTQLKEADVEITVPAGANATELRVQF